MPGHRGDELTVTGNRGHPFPGSRASPPRPRIHPCAWQDHRYNGHSVVAGVVPPGPGCPGQRCWYLLDGC